MMIMMSDNHLHVISAAVAPGPGRHVEGAGGGDEVVALTRVELQGVGHRREGSETDCEHSGELEKHYNTLLQYLNSLETTHNLPSDSGVCAVGDDPGVVLGDHAAVVLVLVDVVDHVSLHSLGNISVNLASNVESANSILPH